MGTLSIGNLAIQLTTPLLLRKPCKLFGSVARVCQRQLGFLVVPCGATVCIKITTDRQLSCTATKHIKCLLEENNKEVVKQTGQTRPTEYILRERKFHVLRVDYQRITKQALNTGDSSVIVHQIDQQETRMLSQALNRAMPHSRNRLEGVDRKKLIFYLAVQLYCTLKQ